MNEKILIKISPQKRIQQKKNKRISPIPSRIPLFICGNFKNDSPHLRDSAFTFDTRLIHHKGIVIISGYILLLMIIPSRVKNPFEKVTYL